MTPSPYPSSEVQWNQPRSTQATDLNRQFLVDVLAGLSQTPKRISCKHFYDQRGSELFNQICELDEYYLTRAELAIMNQYAAEMGDQIGAGVRLVEYGSGSSIKTRILLDHLVDPIAYVPVDISREFLVDVSQQLQTDYPHIEVLPVVADFTKPFSIPDPKTPPSHTAVYFPGSTIGNFEVAEATALLERMARLCGHGGGLLIGVDLEKDPSVLENAYDDSAGVTAEFNLNLMHRLRNELKAQVDIDGFTHLAYYNEELARVEIYIRSEKEQQIEIDGKVFALEAGELIQTEYSHKYTVERFASLANRAGFALHKDWIDPEGYFAVLHLVVE